MSAHTFLALATLALVGGVILNMNDRLDHAGARGEASLLIPALALLACYGAIILILERWKKPAWVAYATSLATLGVAALAFIVGTARLD